MRKGQQPPWIVSDKLWARIEPLLPVVPRRADHPGRHRLDERKVVCGIRFVLYTSLDSNGGRDTGLTWGDGDQSGRGQADPHRLSGVFKFLSMTCMT
ncbi:MAG: transposase, partial [Pseudonocardiaceae bacterium]